MVTIDITSNSFQANGSLPGIAATTIRTSTTTPAILGATASSPALACVVP